MTGPRTLSPGNRTGEGPSTGRASRRGGAKPRAGGLVGGGTAQILVAQISAGGIGVDLTQAHYSVFYSLSFSLGEYDQALSRVHRPGQTRPVEHIHLVVRNTVDSQIMRALEKRGEVIGAILTEIKS